ncbi:ABC transporter ATP-binding protein [Acetanaerobacterium elongatum]|uniref:ATP-binding cassette, subfamily B n=1 Tax=Acetanaerobacterium elongatum TaxID=258515 RepID=A0A1H0C6M9_9FIRM|nr:ABC transporter ATP-binding protein [Acetanaerobacterium elongatum]SDN53523.1 ATP-binding cassette, subfamily B [Acetanaerobacterium elongatum]
MAKLLRYINKYWVFALLGPIGIIGEVLMEIQIPFLMSRIVDVGIPNKDIGYVLQTGGVMILYALLSLLCGAVASFFSSTAAMGFGSEVRKAIFNKVQEFSFANIDKFSTASLVTRLTTDINNTQNAFLMSIRLLVRAPVMLVSATIMAYTINKSLVTVFLLAIPFLAICLAIIASVAFPRFTKMLGKFDKLNASVQENLVAIRVVKAFVRASHEKEKFQGANDDVMYAQRKAERAIIFAFPIMMLTMYSCIIAILWFGGNFIIAGTMLTGELISFITYVTQILIALMMISMVFVMLVLSRASISRINEVLAEKIDITDDNANRNLTVETGTIEFKDVSFRYNKEADTNTLEGINLSIASGETVGIIGGTGSAKTTLVQLIPRLYDVTGGQVLVGGHDVREYTLQNLRNAVSMVLQKNVLFSGSIESNLRWGNKSATDEEVHQAAECAQAHGFIESFPSGYQTDLGQGGVNVSGGQKQRLCIARALLKKPKILILDDSTSAVDTATDAKIRKAFSEELRDTTKLIIAQRVASVCDADKIIVLDDGKIADIGTHSELLARCEIYQEVYNSQLKGVAE